MRQRNARRSADTRWSRGTSEHSDTGQIVVASRCSCGHSWGPSFGRRSSLGFRSCFVLVDFVLAFASGFVSPRSVLCVESVDRVRKGALRTGSRHERLQSLFVFRVRTVSVASCPFGFGCFVVTLVSVRSLAFRISGINVRSVRLFLVFGCYCDVCTAVPTKACVPVSVSSIVGSSTIAPSGPVRSVAKIRIRQDCARVRRSLLCGRCHCLVFFSYGLFFASSLVR